MRASAPDDKAEPMVIAARQEVARILKEHRPPELDRSVQQEVKAVLAQNDIELHGKPIPTKYLDRKV
jgi:trimethylamine:corrinoid methyltransferase-like protein